MLELKNNAGHSVSAVHFFEVGGEQVKMSIAGKKFHLIGIGGIGMSGLARLLICNKAKVSGSDQTYSEITGSLLQSGVSIAIGHGPDNIGEGLDAVVISAAIKEDNPELIAAKARGVKVYKYARMLGMLMDNYEGAAICGTHGKSTTGGWLTFVLHKAGVDPNFVIGAHISQLAASSGVGKSKVFVAEACEYDRSFLNLNPKINCILNIEADHLDYYKDESDIIEAFTQFALKTRPGGTLIVNGHDVNIAKFIGRIPRFIKCKRFGVGAGFDYYAENLRLDGGCHCFELFCDGHLKGTVRLGVPGRHNVLNALAVAAMSANLGLDWETIIPLLGQFMGMERRLTFKGRFDGVTVIDDYAHHPTEIRASLEALKQRYQPKRLFCVFQPHQYSRTRFLLDDFAESFKLADLTVLPEIYFVRDSEESKKTVNSQLLVDRINKNASKAVFIDGFGRIGRYLKENLSDGDLVVTMGAGDIWKVADEYIQRFRTDRK